MSDTKIEDLQAEVEAEGFQEIPANQLLSLLDSLRGGALELAYLETMFEFPTGKWGITEVMRPIIHRHSEGSVTIATTTRGVVTVDELTPVWVRERPDNGTIIDRPDGIKFWQLVSHIHMLRIEVSTGMRHSRGSVLKAAQRRYDLKARTKVAAINELTDLKEKVLAGEAVLP